MLTVFIQIFHLNRFKVLAHDHSAPLFEHIIPLIVCIVNINVLDELSQFSISLSQES